MMSGAMHMDEFILNCCVSSMIADEVSTIGGVESSLSSMNVFSIDENKIRDGNGIIFAEAITCYKCTFCGKMFAAMEVVLTHYQSNHRCSVIPLLTCKGMPTFGPKISSPKLKAPKHNSLNGSQTRESIGTKGKKKKIVTKSAVPLKPKDDLKSDSKNIKSNERTESAANNRTRLLRDSTKNVKQLDNKSNESSYKRQFRCYFPGCSQRFSSKSGVEVHKKSHKKLKSYKCEWNDCEFKCSDLAGLEFHKKTHSGDNPYMCSWPGCHQSFADSAAKEQHMLSQHIGDRILECDYPQCGAKFKLSTDRDKHKLTHTGKRISAPPKLTNGVVVRGRGRPPTKKKFYIEISSSESSVESEDDDEEEEDEEEAEELVSNEKSVDKEAESDPKGEQPLDLSKSGSNSKRDTNKVSEKKTKTPAKRGRKRKEMVVSETVISKRVFRCDYPGCRKTFTESDDLKEHERETHNTLSADGRSRYGRKCKGNLYYKV